MTAFPAQSLLIQFFDILKKMEISLIDSQKNFIYPEELRKVRLGDMSWFFFYEVTEQQQQH